MTTRNNASDAKREADRRRREEEWDRVMRELHEAQERTDRTLIELKVLRELSER